MFNGVKYVREVCKQRGIKISTLERECGFSNGYLNPKKQSKLPYERALKIADYLGVSAEYLMTGDDTMRTLTNVYPIELKKFPMLGEVACGIPRYAGEDRESYVLAGTDIKANFCLRAKGDSMINARILDGDIVFIRKQDMVENGEIAAVVVNNESEATLKRLYYYRDKALLILKAENPRFDDQIYQGKELNDVHILGKAVAFQSDVW